MIKVPPQIAGIIAGLWGVAIGATTQIAIPSWGHYLITAGGVILAGFGIIPSSEAAAPASSSASKEWA